MKKTFLSIVAMTALCFVSCSKEDSGITPVTQPEPTPKVKPVDAPEQNDTLALTWGEDGWPCIPEGDMHLTEEEFKAIFVGHSISETDAYALDEDCKAALNDKFWNHWVSDSSPVTYTFHNDSIIVLENYVIAPGMPYDGLNTHFLTYRYSPSENIIYIDGKKAIKILDVEKDPNTGTTTAKAILDVYYTYHPDGFYIMCYFVSEIKPTITGSSN